MAKKASKHQSPLFPQEVPQMPEGYYSSGPNPNLARFVEEHATPYDPATDEYNVPPFDKPISTTKATAIYNMHTYWSKKPHDAIRQYIRHYTEPGDIVLDSFCGSGGTALAALMEDRAAIAIDLSPAATFITKNYCTPVDVTALEAAYHQLERAVQQEMNWLYETRCDRCDGRATTTYTVYSYIFQCNRCLERVPLFDCVDAQGMTKKGKPKAIKVCPFCHANGHTEEINTRRNQRFDPIPVRVGYRCEEGCKPARGSRLHNDSDPKKRQCFHDYDLTKISEIEEKPIPYWTPPHRMMNVESNTAPWGDKWRAGTSSFRTVAELFTKRNLWALAAYRHAIDELDDLDLRSLLSWVLLKSSKMMRYCSDGVGRITSGTYYLPQISRDSHIPSYIREAYLDMYAHHIAKVQALPVIDELPVLISTQSAHQLCPMSNRSIDYIFTDPPYAEKIQYGELNFIWESWLGFQTDWYDDEIIVNKTRNRTDQDWLRMLQDAMSECFRVLKPGRWLSLCYHDTSEGTWQLVQDMMAEIGFIPETTEYTIYIDTTQKTLNQLFAEKVTKRDLVINFRKPRLGEFSQLTLFGDEDKATFAEKAGAILAETLQAHPGTTADRLYDELVSRMVRRGEFERHNFEDLLNQVAEPVKEPVMETLFEAKPPDLFGGHEVVRWYLRATADQMDEAESAKEVAAAQRLEAYMAAYLAEKPEESGVHYSDLFEQYLPVQDKPRRLLQEWLPEFFFKTDEGVWRPPANDDERAQKEALRTSGALRRIKRFGKALLEGVPPHERDHPTNAATAADWMRQCRRAGLYDLGRILYEKGGFNFDDLDEEALLEVEENYEICVRRS